MQSDDNMPVRSRISDVDEQTFEKRQHKVIGWISFLLIAIISTVVGCVAFWSGMKYQQRVHYVPIIDY